MNIGSETRRVGETKDVVQMLQGARVTWEDLRWIRRAWPGPLIIKGIHTVRDALKATEIGADAIVVSNHGGRQLDGVLASISVLPNVVNAVGERVEVLMDGGIMSGSDVVKALCLGARAVLIGRAYVYGLASFGRSGVSCSVEIFRSEISRTMELLGADHVSQLNPDFLEQSATAF